MTASVTYTGTEVGFIVGALVRVLPTADDRDFEVLDLMLERALAVMPRPLAPDLAASIAAGRVPPLDRFWVALTARIQPGAAFCVIEAALATSTTTGAAFIFLERLCANDRSIVRVGDQHWKIMGAEHVE